jgi:hypothetical protein
MALQPRFGQALSEKIPPLYSISSEIRPVTGLKESRTEIQVGGWGEQR